MSLMGSNIPPPVSGLTQAERVESRAKRPAQKAANRKDDTDQIVVSVESADAVRALKSYDQEDAREDRSEQGGYTPKGPVKQPGKTPHLDVNG